MKRRFISARRTSDSIIEVTYRYWFRPLVDDTDQYDCCEGFTIVYDKRFDQWYTCPKCTNKIERIKT